MGLDGHKRDLWNPPGNQLSGAGRLLVHLCLLFPSYRLACREAKLGAAKVAVFAYVKKTQEPFWQSGIARSTSNLARYMVPWYWPVASGNDLRRDTFAGDRTHRIWGIPHSRVRCRVVQTTKSLSRNATFAAAVQGTSEERALVLRLRSQKRR